MRKKRSTRTSLCRQLPPGLPKHEDLWCSQLRSDRKVRCRLRAGQRFPPVCDKIADTDEEEHRWSGAVAEGSETAKSRPYFRGCSLDSAFWLGAGTTVPSVRNTRRSTMPDMIRTSPIRKRPMVSGRFDRDVSIICTPNQVQEVGQT